MPWSSIRTAFRQLKCDAMTGRGFPIAVMLFLCFTVSFCGRSSSQTRVDADMRLSHVFMSFVPKQKAFLMRTLNMWRQFVPCPGMSIGKLPKLIFLVGTSDAADATLAKDVMAVLEALPSVRECFSGVEWMEVVLKKSDDFHPKGPRLMFEYILRMGAQGGYDCVMQLEPDVRPIRAGWLTEMMRVSTWPQDHFWMKGSIYRGDMDIPVCINGAALYRIGDPEFRKFYFGNVRSFVEKLHKDSKFGYDSDIFEYLGSNKKHYQEVAHLFQFSEFLLNFGHEHYSRKDIVRRHRWTYLVHSGGRGTSW